MSDHSHPNERGTQQEQAESQMLQQIRENRKRAERAEEELRTAVERAQAALDVAFDLADAQCSEFCAPHEEPSADRLRAVHVHHEPLVTLQKWVDGQAKE